jgi:hypothetical protein
MIEHKTCENCGLPSWAVSGDGVEVTIQQRPENRYQKTRRRVVWCHNEECAVQCLAGSRHGRATHKWPLSLAEFRATQPLRETAQTLPDKRMRASRRAKQLVWGLGPMPTAKTDISSPLESGA